MQILLITLGPIAVVSDSSNANDVPLLAEIEINLKCTYHIISNVLLSLYRAYNGIKTSMVATKQLLSAKNNLTPLIGTAMPDLDRLLNRVRFVVHYRITIIV